MEPNLFEQNLNERKKVWEEFLVSDDKKSIDEERELVF